jgi:probable F420-dependent oxidoreductase
VPLRYGAKDEVVDAAAELESLGYSALWIPDVGGDVFGAATTLLVATRSLMVATGVLNLWMHDPADTANGFVRLSGAHPGRIVFGIGVSHATSVDQIRPGRYHQPLAAMAAYLDALDTAKPPVPTSVRVLAALGPKMLTQARQRATGAHTYLTTPQQPNRPTDDDLAGTGSNRLVDALVALGG